ncbi:hypothetical protein HKBW3S44_01956, partial [Candidatus Hakubella thermalkaliphila]
VKGDNAVPGVSGCSVWQIAKDHIDGFVGNIAHRVQAIVFCDRVDKA